jgi:flagellar basal body-associated protein FliL
MKKKIRAILILVSLFLLIASVAFAGVLMSQWTEGTSRFCEYSDGQVIEISFGSTCSSTN